MRRNRRIILLLAVTTIVALFCLPSFTAEKQQKKEQQDQNDIWTEGERRGPGPGRRGPGRRRFDLTEDEINDIMKELKETKPEKAKELEKLRKADPNEFQSELRKHGREEFGKILRERMNAWREKRRAEFLEWLAKNYRKQADELSKLKGQPDLYWKKFELIRREYWRIFEEEKRNPDLAEVLKEDLRLKKRRDDLLRRIKAAKNDKDKKKLTEQLKDVVSNRYDLIVRRKEIAYDRLLNWVEDLKRELKKSREDIHESRNKKVKADNVQKRVKDLIAGGAPFKWD